MYSRMDRLKPDKTLTNKKDAEQLVKFLIESKVDPHTTNLAGDSPLHYAIRIQSRLLIELLVNCRADIMQLDANGKTAIQMAESQGMTEIAKFLALEHEKRRAINSETTAVADTNDVSP